MWSNECGICKLIVSHGLWNVNVHFRVVIMKMTWPFVAFLLGMGKTEGKFLQWRLYPITCQFPS